MSAATAETGVLLATSRAAVSKAVASIPEGLLRLVEVDTSNLWRLQAQQGLFIETRAYGSDPIPMVAVEFRHSIAPPIIPRLSIYPNAKSALELHLDGFFETEKRRRARRFWQDELKATVIKVNPPQRANKGGQATDRIDGRNTGLGKAELEVENRLHDQLASVRGYPLKASLRLLPSTFYPSQLRFITGSLSPHESWFAAARWRAWNVETYSEAGAGGESIRIAHPENSDSLESLASAFARQFEQLGLLESRRFRTAQFSFSGPYDEANDVTKICRNLQLLWDGMRKLPITDALICRALAQYCTLEAWSLLQHRAAADIFEEAHGGVENLGFFRAECVQIGYPTTQYYFASQSAETMMRSDLFEHVQIVEKPTEWSLPVWLLSQIVFPQYLFDFEKFAEVYLAEAVPASLAIYGTFAPCFNPLQTKVFGRR